MIRDRPISIVVNSTALQSRVSLANRGTFTFSDGTVVKPASSTSLISSGKSMAQMFIWLGDVFGDNIHHELARAPDIARRILGHKRLARPVRHPNTHDRRIGAKVVVRAEGRRIQPAFLVHAGDQRNRPRRHQPYQQLVGIGMRRFLQVVYSCGSFVG
jgi:hypothetical protein